MHKYVVANNLTIYLYVIMCCIFTCVIAFTLCTLLLEFIKKFYNPHLQYTVKSSLLCSGYLSLHSYTYTYIYSSQRFGLKSTI